VLVVIAAVVAVVALSGDDDPEETSTQQSTTTEDQPSTTEDINLPPTPSTEDDGNGGTGSPPADDAVQLVDSGFSVYFDELYDVDYLTWGAMVENTSEQVARSVRVQVGFLDDSGTVLGTDEETIRVLMPGATVGVGDSGIEATQATQLDIQVTPPSEWGDPAEFGEITTSGISVEFDSDYNAPTISFTAASTYSDQVDGPYFYAIFRDANENILGAESDWSSVYIPPGGQAVGEIDAYDSIGNIEGLDASKTLVFVDPDIW
jgi:hypothetical protein